jgi:hypothetical protein
MSAVSVTYPMSNTARRFIGGWLGLVGAVVLGHVMWAWSLASRLEAAPAAAHVRAHWLGLEFSPTAQFSLLLIVVTTAMAGSLATIALVFSNRAGHRTLEERWEWWYLLRPLAAASIAILFYMVVLAGLLGGADKKAGGLAFAAAVGGLAGLFTDRVLETMRSALGASAFNTSASNPEEAKNTGGTGVAAPASTMTTPDPAQA